MLESWLTLPVLRGVMPHLPSARGEYYLRPLREAFEEFHINTKPRVAVALAQMAQESGELRFWHELANGEAYEGREDLGNVLPGDGKRFKGRGPIQLTGRKNYRETGLALKLDLEGHPEWVEDPEIGFRVFGWYWKSHGCNELADKRDFVGITRAINGGLTHQLQRVQYYRRALHWLAVTIPS